MYHVPVLIACLLPSKPPIKTSKPAYAYAALSDCPNAQQLDEQDNSKAAPPTFHGGCRCHVHVE
jgi:hypothetical protein